MYQCITPWKILNNIPDGLPMGEVVEVLSEEGAWVGVETTRVLHFPEMMDQLLQRKDCRGQMILYLETMRGKQWRTPSQALYLLQKEKDESSLRRVKLMSRRPLSTMNDLLQELIMHYLVFGISTCAHLLLGVDVMTVTNCWSGKNSVKNYFWRGKTRFTLMKPAERTHRQSMYHS